MDIFEDISPTSVEYLIGKIKELTSSIQGAIPKLNADKADPFMIRECILSVAYLTQASKSLEHLIDRMQGGKGGSNTSQASSIPK